MRVCPSSRDPAVAAGRTWVPAPGAGALRDNETGGSELEGRGVEGQEEGRWVLSSLLRRQRRKGNGLTGQATETETRS